MLPRRGVFKTLNIYLNFAGGSSLGLPNDFTIDFRVPSFSQELTDFIIGYLRDSAIKAQRIGKQYNIKVANFVFENPQWMKEDLKDIWEEEWKQDSFKDSWLKTKTAYTNLLL